MLNNYQSLVMLSCGAEILEKLKAAFPTALLVLTRLDALDVSSSAAASRIFVFFWCSTVESKKSFDRVCVRLRLEIWDTDDLWLGHLLLPGEINGQGF
jgi:hypothetical protein